MDLRLLLAAMLSLLPLAAGASEFADDDVLPVQQDMLFDKDQLYFQATMYMPLPSQTEWYSFDRQTHELLRLKEPPPIHATSVPRERVNGRCEFRLETGDGKGYGACLPDCDDDQDQPGSLTDLATGEVFFAHTPKCLGPGTVEQVGDKLLVGAWESGDYSLAVSPVAVLDGKTHALLKSIDFSADVIRRDPYAPQVWLVGSEGAMLLDEDLNPKQRWYFYRGFDPVDHVPKLLVSDQPHQSDPFAAVAWDLHVSDVDGWYKAVQALPAETRAKFNMYGFFMGMIRLSDPKYPGLQSLVPFFIGPMQAQPQDQEFIRVLKDVCPYPDPRVDGLIAEMTASKDRVVSSSGKWCADERAKQKPAAN